MSNIYTSADQLIGKTPLLELTHIEKAHDLKAKIVAKLEYFNPAGSVKDRVASTFAFRPSFFSIWVSSSSGVFPISWSADV